VAFYPWHLQRFPKSISEKVHTEGTEDTESGFSLRVLCELRVKESNRKCFFRNAPLTHKVILDALEALPDRVKRIAGADILLDDEPLAT